MNEKISGRRRFYSAAYKGITYFCAGITVLLLAALIAYILCRGLPNVSWSLLTTAPSALKGTVGILPNLLSTLYIIVCTLIVALPVGIGAAIYLNEYATNRKLVVVIEFASETLAGIPSILYGLVGMLFFRRIFGLNVISGSLTVAIMVLPAIIRTTQEALKAVPASYREGAAALGAGKWHLIRTIILPASLDGIVGGSILAIGRIVGESAALLFTAGLGATLAGNLADALTQSSGSLSVALYVYVAERGDFNSGFAIAAILIILIFIINAAARLMKRLLKRGKL